MQVKNGFNDVLHIIETVCIFHFYAMQCRLQAFTSPRLRGEVKIANCLAAAYAAVRWAAIIWSAARPVTSAI
jgi:hypothetical protein